MTPGRDQGPRRRRLLAVPAMVLVGAALACATPPVDELTRPATARRPPAAVPTAAPPPARNDEEEGYLGVLLAGHTVEVAAEVGGTLARIDVRAGDEVQRGMPIATLLTEDLRRERAMAEAALAAARAAERRAVIEHDQRRAESRRRAAHPNLFAAEERQRTETEARLAGAALDVARAEVDRLRTALTGLRKRLERATLKSPVAGHIAARYRDAGAVVRPGEPIVRILGHQGLVVRFAVPPGQIGELAPGQGVEVQLDEASLTLSGVISQIAPQVDRAAQMVFVEATVDPPSNAGERLRHGLVGRVSPTASATSGH